jgi:glycosyltransferase involved in cell wall biosynthesis
VIGREGRVRDRGEHGKLRVGFDARWYNDSGVGTYVAGLLHALSRLSEVELVVYEDPANPVPDLAEACVRKPVRSGKYSAVSQIQLAQLCRRDRLHVFHSPFYMVPFVAECAVVITVHDLIPFLFPIYSPAKQSLVKVGYKAAVKKATHVIAVSEQTASDLRKILHVPAERITGIHNGVRGDIFRPEKQPSELQCLREKYQVQPPYVMAASARNWRTKNLDSALAVLGLARQISGMDFSIVVFGPEEGLKAIGTGPSNVLAVGHIPAPDLAMLFRNAEVFIAPSLYEGFGLPVLEAMSCGCAVIASNRGSLAEIAGSGGQIFPPFDIAAMAHAVAGLICRPDVLWAWRNSALQRAADFSWELTAKETLRVYHHVAFGEQRGSIPAAAD